MMVCIQICADVEWKAVLEIIDPEQNKINWSPFGQFFISRIHEYDCLFFHSGDTKTCSAAACQYAIDHWKPDLLINIGTSGCVDKKLKLMDIVLANKTVQYDCIMKMGLESDLFYSKMITEVDNSWIDLKSMAFPLAQGIIATADQDLDFHNRQILQNENVLVADWESGAIAHVCKINKVKYCILRGITDIPHDSTVESEKNQQNDFENYTPEVMLKLIKYVVPQLLTNL